MSQELIDSEIRRLGSGFDADVLSKTRELYRPFVSEMPWMQGRMTPNVPYGSHERHRLDIFTPERPNAPILLFVHGGGFVGGDKAADATFYANVGHYFASCGYLAVTMNYRLSTTHPWPAGTQDVEAATHWLRDHASALGGDPTRAVVMGQSAGAAHVAGFLFSKSFETIGTGFVRAIALLSGFYELHAPMAHGPKTYYGDDPALWLGRAPIDHVKAAHPPILLSVAELDPSAIASHTLALAAKLNEVDGRTPPIHWFAGHNHVSPVHGFGIGPDVPGKVLHEFFQKHLG